MDVTTLDQPLLECNLRRIYAGEKRISTVDEAEKEAEAEEEEELTSTYSMLFLLPELCNVIGLTFEMYNFGLFIADVCKHVHATMRCVREMDQWQKSYASFQIRDIRLLKQVCAYRHVHSHLTRTTLVH